ncbi:hypothetical protein JF535_05860 [Microbulbifer salipaludis]|uniref:PepSY domain-containing protein n=1 Tax=Microbulbifer salipaludis TaxID=187980 RepID=A0ABS3E517_9GAMM|nr:hypothetical protein [Microbulbifer salipaludis]MBN8430377.1 hypothetical protein [Microbulbifer salipaludis]
MGRASLSRKIHKWLFLFVGIQALLWTLSGVYMVVMDLDFIHGDHLVKNLSEPLPANLEQLAPTAEILERYRGVKHIQLKALQGNPYYVVKTGEGAHLVDARSGREVPPVDSTRARALAEHYYSGELPAASAELITSNPPTEVPSRALPLWRVNFDDRYGTSLYIDPSTGALATRRHNYWRAFDFFWMLHIMDYEERADIHNPLLLVISIVSLTGVLAGLILLFYSFARRGKAPGNAATAGGAG